MKKLFEKDEIGFALIWIGIYVAGFSCADMISEAMGMPKLLTVLYGLVLSVCLYGFIRRNHLSEYLGLRHVQGSGRQYLYYIPLMIVSSVNLWHGFALNGSAAEIILYVISMCFVGFLEEVIFRGLLFKGMYKSNLTSAVIVSSVTFGMGHIVNLFLGEPLAATLLQLLYASAIGFCYTALFCAGGSLLPCILSHAFINATSVFAPEPSLEKQVLFSCVLIVLDVGYGLWLLRRIKGADRAGNHDTEQA